LASIDGAGFDMTPYFQDGGCDIISQKSLQLRWHKCSSYRYASTDGVGLTSEFQDGGHDVLSCSKFAKCSAAT